LVFKASLLDVQHKGTVWSFHLWSGRLGGRWQLDSKTERSFRCLLAKATW